MLVLSKRVGRSCIRVPISSTTSRRVRSSDVVQGERTCRSERIYNVGFIAHIDAGKTTTTERMLYFADVDSGNTVMDYLPPERERGITISSAAISLPWSGCTLNLIDTPGHADFTFEVERILRVLDGAVVLLDASAGVEAQTVAVWRQAKSCKIPCVAFVNKMDSSRANLQSTVESMEQQLGVQPVLTQLPVGDGRDFQGVVDLLHMHALMWPQETEGTSYFRVLLENLPQDTQKLAHHYREQLLEQVAMVDDELASVLLGSDSVSLGPEELSLALQRSCASGAIVPVLCGSALRGVAIQPLMDAAINYLPPASKLSSRIPVVARGLCAYAFKQVYDSHRGLLAYVRVISGSLKSHTSIYNLSTNSRERVTRVLMAQADQLQDVKEAGEGRIAVAVGLKNTSTGDTLVQSTAVAKSLEEEGVVSLLTPPTVPPPVFLCTVEPSSSANQKNLEEALLILSREDPSLRVTFDSDTGQTVLSGMGELHLEVVEERLKRVFGVECELGQLQVAYRESLLQETLATAALNRAIGSSKHSVFARVGLYPREPGTGVSVRFGSEVKMEKSVTRVLSSVVETSLTRGPLLGFPVEGVSVCVEELTGDGVALLSACLAQAVQKALEVAEIGLLEPLTQLEIVVPEQFVGVVLSDLTSARRAQVQCLSEGVGGERTVLAQVPLATLLGYAKHLRSMTSGSASFTMLSAGHLQMDNHQQNAVVKQIRGY